MPSPRVWLVCGGAVSACTCTCCPGGTQTTSGCACCVAGSVSRSTDPLQRSLRLRRVPVRASRCLVKWTRRSAGAYTLFQSPRHDWSCQRTKSLALFCLRGEPRVPVKARLCCPVAGRILLFGAAQASSRFRAAAGRQPVPPGGAAFAAYPQSLRSLRYSTTAKPRLSCQLATPPKPCPEPFGPRLPASKRGGSEKQDSFTQRRDYDHTNHHRHIRRGFQPPHPREAHQKAGDV